jgi:prepilin-type N-terminal cleavage/methylation domain-containing protein
MKKKGFTLVELLVVIAIIAMLLAILMPALGRVRGLAYRLMCGTNLGGIGKAMSVYANDYQEQYPVRSGATNLKWDYKNSPSFWDMNLLKTPNYDWATVTTATISSSLYLLIKYADAQPGSFVCKATSGSKKFEIATTGSTKQNYTNSGIKDVSEAWDFGKNIGFTSGPWDYCSYAYQLPYLPGGQTPSTSGPFLYAPSASTPAGVPIMADASPWFKKGQAQKTVAPSGTAMGPGPYMPISVAEWSSKDKARLANSINHSQDGQNVLFGDTHVSFEAQSNVGIQQDNIYSPWANYSSNNSDDPLEVQSGKYIGGTTPTFNDGSFDMTGADSFLVN